MTPLLAKFQADLIATGMVRADQITIYITEAKPEYTLPFDPDENNPPTKPVSLGIAAPATIVVQPFGGDIIDLMLVCNLILDDMEPAPKGDANRLKVSAEPLNKDESVIVMNITLQETIHYIADPEGPFNINGHTFSRHHEPAPALKPLHSVHYVGP